MGDAAQQPTASQLRDAAIDILRTLRAAGHTAYLAGGCVRDELLGLAPKDYDIATDATPDRVHELYPHAHAVGKAFGVMIVRSRDHGGAVTEVATFRKEGAYSDSRRPDAIEFSSEIEDAKRRDFTLNALFLDPLGQNGEPLDITQARVIDHVGGRADLEAGLIRAVGDPAERLAEDHLRALRAVRFAARYGFAIEPSTAQAIADHAQALRGVSAERIGDEVRRMLTPPGRAVAARLMQSLGLDEQVFGDRSENPTPILNALSSDADPMAALAAWYFDRLGGGGTFDSVARADHWKTLSHCRRSLVLSNDEQDLLRAILARLREIADWATARTASRKRSAVAKGFDAAMALLSAWDPDSWRQVRESVVLLAADGIGLAPDPLITGDELRAQGLRPGPRFKDILAGVYDAQLEGAVRDADEALELASQLAQHPPNGADGR